MDGGGAMRHGIRHWKEFRSDARAQAPPPSGCYTCRTMYANSLYCTQASGLTYCPQYLMVLHKSKALGMGPVQEAVLAPAYVTGLQEPIL